jgi:DNA-binding phage protein
MLIVFPPFDPADYLEDEEAILAYLKEAEATGDPEKIAEAQAIAERARGKMKSAG